MNARENVTRFIPAFNQALNEEYPGACAWLLAEPSYGGHPAVVVSNGGDRRVPVTFFCGGEDAFVSSRARQEARSEVPVLPDRALNSKSNKPADTRVFNGPRSKEYICTLFVASTPNLKYCISIH